MKFEFAPIGTIHSPFSEPEDMPIQPAGAEGYAGTVEVFEGFRAGLVDLDGFSHIFLLDVFHYSRGFDLRVVPFLDSRQHGVFATRAPRRPNPIGLSVVRLERIEHGVLQVSNIDILDGTPLLDIKPYVPAFDAPDQVRSGWLEKTGGEVLKRKADSRFREKD